MQALVDKADETFGTLGISRELREYIKTQLNDSESFKLEESEYFVSQDSIVIVKLTYSAKNAFNSRVKNSLRAKCKIDGSVISIEQM